MMKPLLILSVLLVGLLPQQGGTQQPPTPAGEPVTLVVRDGAGNGLAGIAIDIALVGPPHEAYGTCTTDSNGECQLSLPASDYTLTFKDWQGTSFGAASSQNQGPVEEAGELLSEGFGLHIEPLGQTQTYLFVIARDTSGSLVPLWDNARSRDQAPDPYIASQQQGTLTLGPLAPGTASTATPQVIVSGYDSTTVPTATGIPATTAAPASPGGLLGLIACAGMAALAAAGVWLFNRRPNGSRKGTSQ
jgi:hypothetical protein